MTITLAQAFDQWNSDNGMGSPVEIFGDDVIALSESWNDYTDSLCKDGELTDLQYHHCPGYGDTADIPGDDWESEGEFLLGAMGVTFSSLRIATRPDGCMDDMPGASHWRVLMRRGSKEYTFHYSMGSAHTGTPGEADLFSSLLSDTSDIEGNTFEDWAESLGMDTDSRKAEKMFKACQQTALELGQMFTKSELDDLREIFSNY